MHSVGQMLRKARKERQRTLEAISSETRIPVASLRLMEADTFDELPGDIFVRGFLKSYCQALAIEDRDILDTYVRQTGSPAEVRSSPIPSFGGRKLVPARLVNLSWIVALVLFLILGALLLVIIFHPGPGGGGGEDRNVQSGDSTRIIETTL